jgi:hypothetical protein
MKKVRGGIRMTQNMEKRKADSKNKKSSNTDKKKEIKEKKSTSLDQPKRYRKKKEFRTTGKGGRTTV